MPVLLFCTTPFTPMAKAITEGKGLPDLRIIEMDHPLGGLTDPEITERFEQVIDTVFRHLEGPPL
ncbi:MAG: hypothetical protein ABS81_10985 [Pseudonocardia sp. SCN 72-86]|nr:MAG: hypothetical protein ABS81_10985 [Pseudonocardia sp. SCN 72-86]